MAIGAKTKEELTIEAINEPKQIDTSVDIKIPRSKILFDPSKHKFKCSCCGKGFVVQKSNFHKTESPLFQENNGYLPWCKNCTDLYWYGLVNLYSGNEAHATEDFCHTAGWVFDSGALMAAKKISSDRSRISGYAAKKNLNVGDKKTYIDTIKAEYENRPVDVIDTLEDAKDSKRVKLRTVKFFGTGFTDDDYVFLEDEYLDWTTRHECSTKAQEEVFKQICFAQLDILKAKRGNLATKDLTKTLQDLLATANLQPKQTKDNTLAEQNTFGTLIRKWENEKPIPEPDEEWKDVDGIVRYVTVYFLGHLCKMMGIKNSYSRLYELEMSKYKVDKPEYEDDEEALFDAVFGGELDDSTQ
ncbi:hypothetical protein [Clostridium sp. HBUAS56010]|uniref:hypothetical protein n=1 Tax=Clostridium sp. HBUAS56010 TaxID=2571127 RepID=UPI0011788E0C|nr:hypothetical protein [Clostridium sp. HBUAS56010]